MLNLKNDEIDKIEALGYYNEMLDFKILKKEFLTWKFCLDTFKDKDKDKYNLNSIVSIADSIST